MNPELDKALMYPYVTMELPDLFPIHEHFLCINLWKRGRTGWTKAYEDEFMGYVTLPLAYCVKQKADLFASISRPAGKGEAPTPFAWPAALNFKQEAKTQAEGQTIWKFDFAGEVE